MVSEEFLEMIRKTAAYVKTIVPKDDWTLGDQDRCLELNNGDLTIFLYGRDGCFVHVLNHARKRANSYSILKLNIFHHAPSEDWLEECDVEKELYEAARKIFLHEFVK